MEVAKIEDFMTVSKWQWWLTVDDFSIKCNYSIWKDVKKTISKEIAGLKGGVYRAGKKNWRSKWVV